MKVFKALVVLMLVGVYGSANIKDELRREARRDGIREGRQSVRATEGKEADYELGKTVIDVRGRRVRIEEYVTRPDPNTFKYILLNTRENRKDYHTERYTFNEALPSNLTKIRPNVWKPIDNVVNSDETIGAGENYLTEFHAKSSNMYDYVDRSLRFDPKGELDGVQAKLVYSYGVGNLSGLYHLKERLTVIDKKNIYHQFAGGEVKISGGTVIIKGRLPDYQKFESPSLAYKNRGEKYYGQKVGDIWDPNTTPEISRVNYERFIIDDNGHIQPKRGAGLTKGTNHETIIMASEFNGRDIDLVRPIRFLASEPDPVDGIKPQGRAK
ncbi:MAG: hypothetical protein AAB267_07175 [Candidatus Desantisbacteria bacterium]